MGRKFKKPQDTPSVIKEYLEQKKSVQDLEEKNFVVSFMHLDPNQGARFIDWQSDGMLAPALDTLAGYCHRSLTSQQDKKFTIYGGFPARTKFTHPSHVPPDANWARIHVNGKHILAGHVYQNTFYVVFLDSDHSFFVTKGADN